MKKNIALLLTGLSFLFQANVFAQNKAHISEEVQSLKTYPYDDPDPVPVLGSNPKIYPYHKFDGYSHEGKPMDWKVVKLENDYIEVYVLPETGGKVYGAIEKSTGEEFIYKNEVMKFRNISMRGPWTSGGIEFNFGIIGHHPSTASPVDYRLMENEDGSVSCWVGTMDLPSRTQWRVEIRLPKDKAYFETRVLWHNPTPLRQSYYNWMTAAAAATEDLELFCPGNTYLTHPGDPLSWPYDAEGRHIAEYKFNNYGPSKSYHVVGEYNTYFGGYFHEKDFGFGHYALYEEMPGQKLWLWSLARDGGIWEDLLTDTDGQYIEFQAGRMFDQYFPEGYNNPITQAGFAPGSADAWREIWFPVKKTGGISAVSEQAVVHVQRKEGEALVIVNALSPLKTIVKISLGNQLVSENILTLSPMQVDTLRIRDTGGILHLSMPEADIHYTSDPQALAIKRPFEAKPPTQRESPSFHYFDGLEEMEFRNYDKAEVAFKTCISLDPWHIDAMVSLAEIYFRNARYDKGLEIINQALSIDTYHAGANYLAGILYRASEDPVNALESLGWAARSPQYRAAAYSEMAQISLFTRDYDRVLVYADKAVAYDPLQISALWAKAAAYRIKKETLQSMDICNAILRLDPLSHLAKAEKYLTNPSAPNYQELIRLNNEFPHETFLETAIQYANAGLYENARQILILGPTHTENLLWVSWLFMKEGNKQDIPHLNSTIGREPDFVFPYRRESLPVMDWAFQVKAEWKTAYFLGLNYWALNRKEEAKMIFQALAYQPDFAPFYIARADLTGDSYDDVKRALELAPGEWRYHHRMIQEEWAKNNPAQALTLAQKAVIQFPGNYTLGFDLAKASLNTKDYTSSIRQLSNLNILPFEGASEGRTIYEEALLRGALEAIQNKNHKQADAYLRKSLEWPENLGVGKPYDTDESLSNYLLGLNLQKQNRKKAAEVYFHKVIGQSGSDSFLTKLSRKALGENLTVTAADLPESKNWRIDIMRNLLAL